MEEQKSYERIRTLTDQLNRYRDEYYNKNAPSVSDDVYDRMFDELVQLEKESGIVMANSPTQTVGYPAVSELQKTAHAIPLLSLDKTKTSEELLRFMGDQPCMLMFKLDGLTMKLTYENRRLVEAATRGNGDIGEIVTHNARGISGIPTLIPFPGRLVVTGEAYIRPSDFEALKTSVTDGTGEPYKNGRNLAAGSVRLLDPAACKERKVSFTAFSVLEGMDDTPLHSARLNTLKPLGFNVCTFITNKRPLKLEELEGGIEQLKHRAKDSDYPIDGIVVKYNDAAFGASCGRTGHHYKDGLAFKFEDDLYETRMTAVEWNPSRTGEITPVAIFETVEIDGCSVSRASLHNLSFMENLELMPGNRILISKRNMIIPHVEENLDRGGFDLQRLVPPYCPCCGQPTRIHKTVNAESGEQKTTRTLFCDNESCDTRRLRQFVHFVGKKAMDIDGLSEGTLEKLIGWGWLHSYTDIYRLDRYANEIVSMEGFGQKSWSKLWEAIQRSRDTSFERFLVAMDIPMVGSTASRALSELFHGSLDEFEAAVCGQYDFTQLPDFGDTLNSNIHEWFQREEHWALWAEMREILNVLPPVKETPEAGDRSSISLNGMIIVVTGKVEPYTREEIHAFIRSKGGVPGDSVTKKTSCLVCGDKPGSKLQKAKELGITVLSPAEFFSLFEPIKQ